MEKINVRSPHFIRSLAIGKDYVKCELHIYAGQSVINRGVVDYTLINRTPADGYSVFEISELIRDFINLEFDGSYDSEMIWVDYRFIQGTDLGGDATPTSYVEGQAFEGYGYFEEGAATTLTPINEQKLLQSNTVIIKPQNTSVRIPIIQDSTYSVLFSYKGNLVEEYNITNNINALDRIAYLNDYIGVDTDTYKERVLQATGIYEGSNCLDNLLGMFDFTPIDRIIVDGDTVIDIQTVKECRFEPIKATFVNKFGAYQDLWFFKRNSKAIRTQSTEYLSNIVTTGTWSAANHQKAMMGNNGQEDITLNSGYYPESYNEIFKQLLLSERVWLELDGITRPVNVSSKGMDFKTQLTEKLIEYTMKFDFSNDIINNIR